MSIKKDKYEISLWEDYIVSAQGEGENLIPEHYEERKIAIIGSDTMTAQWRAVEPKLVNNINGTNTLTFKMFYSFINNETGEKEDNPMLKLMVNERKIKCFWKNKWYDLVIKSCQEDSNGKSITYTCKDLFINELSKTGFDLEFDTELKNNQGTVDELATTILKGTDWQLGTSDIIKQNIEEPVYEVNVVSSFVTDNNINISAGDKILVFYSVFINKSTFFQFWYDDSQLFITDKSSMLVDNGSCESIEIIWSEITYNGIPSWAISYNDTIIAYISKEAVVSDKYHAKRLVRAQSQILDPLVDKYVYQYTKKSDGKEIYGYPETKYDDVIAIVNYITNGEEFSSTDGWAGSGIIFQLYPLFSPEVGDNYEAKSYLKIPKSLVAYNSGIKDHRSYIEDGFIKGEKYIFRIKAMTELKDGPSGTYCNNNNIYLQPWIGQYTLNTDTNTYTKTGSNYFTVNAPVLNGNWVEFTLTCDKSATPTELLKLGLFIDNSNSNTGNRWLEKVEFFKYAVGDPVVQEYSSTKTFVEDDVVLYNNIYYICIKNNTGIIPTNTSYWKNLGSTKPKIRINPGSYSAQSYANIVWKFYEAGQSVLNIEDLNYLFSSDEISAKEYISNNLNPIYNDNYEKIRSITAKNSNRFNLLQSLAETFECWINFEIEHDEDTGRVIYNKGVPQKWVSFKSDIGIETGVGFVYGIDLKTISRTITSDAITSKVIVSPNNNEYGENGFCSISRATENYPKTNFILNFDYYISQGLLSQGQINKDLYSSVEQIGIGYYYWLNKYNTNYDAITKLIIEKENELTKQKSLQKVYDERINETSEEITSVEDELARLIGYTTFNVTQIQNYLDKYPDNITVKNLWIVRNNLKTSLKTYSAQLSNLNKSVESLDNYINGTNGLVEQQEQYVEKIEELDKKFYDKYSRFIQEGSWTSEDYYDDNLYYLDAVSTAYTSSRPQISYNISVLRLSALEEFKNKVFNLGDISFIQDIEFFGYTNINGVKTPYKEKVLVSEITSNFDSPEKDSFKVQNYKTQFEDLFQRITATTQSLQYATGAYNKAADSFTATGEIEGEILEKSFQLNQNLAWAAQDDSVVYDTTGMTVVDTTDPTKIVRISSKGIQITEDGGEHWYLGITGSGISTKYLTSGFIATDKISIMDGAYPTFKWDKYGINAFYYELLDGVISNVNDGNFVRFDRFGLYGINTELSGAWLPETEDEIWETGKFGLTWKGFFMKNKYGNGYVSISSIDDFVVNDGTKNRIKIGNIGTQNNPIYGLLITDADGAKVMETNSDGTLWLKNRLNVETSDNYSVGIGKLGASVEGGKNEVINANNKFLVYEDGSIKATDGEFSGTIYATGGTIGGMNIASIVSNTKRVEIISNGGFVFLSNTPDNITLTATLNEVTGTLTYQWFKDGNIISGANSNSLIIKNSDVTSDSSSIYKVTITETINGASTQFSNVSTIQKISGVDTAYYEIITNQDYIQKQYVRDSKNNSILHFNVDLLNIQVKQILEKEEIILNPSNYIMKFYFLNSNTWTEINSTLTEIQPYLYIDSLTNSWIFNISDFVQVEQFIDDNLNNLLNLLLNEETALKFEFYSLDSNIALYTKTVQVSYAISKNLAAFSLNAYDVTASIDSTALVFNADGLTINNGGFVINRDSEYIITKDSTLETGKIYYELIDDIYVQTTDTSFVAEKIYYEYYPKITLLEYNEDSRTLSIQGSGTFTGNVYATNGIFKGTVYATDGEFTGIIKANSGTIGGFKINENSIVSAGYKETEDSNYISGKVYYELIDEEYIITTDTIFEEGKTYYEYTSNGSIELINDPITNSGIIKVNNIELGEGAVISNYIKLGNSYIYNPNLNQGRFIEVTDGSENSYISIKNDGIAKFGSITIDGTKSEISGKYFTIAPERSNFSNVDITGTIHSSVFETGQVQSVGGAMFFRESAQIEIINDTTFKTITNINLKIGSYVLLTNDNGLNIYGYITNIDKNNQQYVIDAKTNSISDATTIIHLADIENNIFTNNLLIGVNSQNSVNKNLQPNAITFAELFSIDEKTYEPTYSAPKILLGDLSLLEDRGINGYGLYGENVYLTGSLTTQVNNNSYAGINTLSGANAIKFNGDKTYYEKTVDGKYQKTSDTRRESEKIYYIYNDVTKTYDELDDKVKFDISKIVFWAGSDDTNAESIQNSKFQVTENGSLFAARGLFEESIITNSIIQASDLYAIRLFGGTETETAALNIYDTNQGIVFKTREINENLEKETLRLNSNGFSIDRGTSYFVEIKDNKIFFDGEELNSTSIMTKSIENYFLKITGSKIESFLSGETNTSLGYLNWTSDFYSIGLNNTNNITQNTNQISLSTNLVQVNNNINFGQTMKYERYINDKNVECGYDLYISD